MGSEGLYKRVNVKTGENCKISPFCSLENVVIADNVTIGDGVQLKNVVIGSNTKLGRNVTIYSPATNRPVRIGESCWFSYGVFAEATGGEVKVGSCVVVAHSTTILTSSGPGEGNPVMSAIYPDKLGPVSIGDNSWVGAHCVLIPGAFLEEGVVIGANSLLLAGTYKAWAVYGGTPAKMIKKLDPKAVKAAKAKFLPKE